MYDNELTRLARDLSGIVGRDIEEQRELAAITDRLRTLAQQQGGSGNLADLPAKWRRWADGLYRAEPANRIRDCADELETALAQQGKAVGVRGFSAWVSDMKTSAGMDYFVCVGHGTEYGEYMTPNSYKVRGRASLNDLARMEFTREDREQFAQLIGYSHSGSGDLSYMSDEVWYAAQSEYEARTEAESAAGPARHSEEVMQIETLGIQGERPVARGEDGKASPLHEGHRWTAVLRTYDHCPKCTAHIPPGTTCGGPNCGLKQIPG